MHGNVTYADINLMFEITQAITFKIIVLNNISRYRPPSDKFPVISHLHAQQKVRSFYVSFWGYTGTSLLRIAWERPKIPYKFALSGID